LVERVGKLHPKVLPTFHPSPWVCQRREISAGTRGETNQFNDKRDPSAIQIPHDAGKPRRGGVQPRGKGSTAISSGVGATLPQQMRVPNVLHEPLHDLRLEPKK